MKIEYIVRVVRVLIIFSYFYTAISLSATPSDSSNVPLSKYTVKVQGSVLKTTPVTNENYGSLPSCPGDPSNGSAFSGPPQCPDINGVWPSTVNKSIANYKNYYCPDLCTMTQNTITQPNQTIYNPICPQGYSQVAAYNAQPAYEYNMNPPPIFPVLSMSDFNHYSGMGYSCHETYNNYGSWHDGTCTSNSPKWGNGTNTDAMPGYSGVVYMYHFYQHCWTGGSSCGLHAVCGTAGERYTYDYDYDAVGCYPPPGNYPTSGWLPASIVCAKVQPTWCANGVCP